MKSMKKTILLLLIIVSFSNLKAQERTVSASSSGGLYIGVKAGYGIVNFKAIFFFNLYEVKKSSNQKSFLQYFMPYRQLLTCFIHLRDSDKRPGHCERSEAMTVDVR